MSSPQRLIKSMTIFLDSTIDNTVRGMIEAAAAPFSAKIVERPEGHPSWMSYWEATKGDYFDVCSSELTPIERFTCFVTQRHLSHSDVAYAVHGMQIPTLSLDVESSVSNVMSAPLHLFDDVEQLCGTMSNGADEKIRDAIGRFFDFPEVPGRIFVIEGGDGAGKETQTKLMITRLQAEGRKVKTLDFPNDASPSGWAIRDVLSGKCGNLKDIAFGAFAALYSFNRFEKRKLLHYWVQKGVNVILDRYMTANFGYHCLRVEKDEDRKHEIMQMEAFECNYLFLPKAHRVAYLQLSPLVAMQSLLADASRKELDMFERASIERKKTIQGCFKWCCKQYHHQWACIPCVEGDEDSGRRLTREEVHESIYNLWRDEFV